MKALINCSADACGWTEKFFPGYSPYMLPFLAKPLIEYYIDWCVLSGVSEVLVICEEYDEDLSEFLSDASKWGLEIHVSASASRQTRSEQLKSHSFFGKDGGVILDGFFFPLYDKNAENVLPEINSARVLTVPSADSAPARLRPLEVKEIDGILAFYELNMTLLEKNAGMLITKAYSAEEGVFMGMNVGVARRAILNPPFVIGDNVQIESVTQIEPGAIIGNTCIIDMYTRVSRSVIFSNTYVGADLEIRGKIIYGNRMIDPFSGETMSFTDNFFSSERKKLSLTRIPGRFAEVTIAALIWLLLLPARLFFLCIGSPESEIVQIPAKDENTCLFYRRYTRSLSLKGIWFFKLCLDKFHLLPQVIRGELKLVGDTIHTGEAAGENLKRYKKYTPGAFSYADSLRHYETYETIIDDLYYKHTGTVKTNIQVLLRTLTSRLLSNEPYRS